VTPTRPADPGRKWLLGTVLFAAVIAAHFPASRNAFIWDDDSYLTENVLVQSPDGLGRIWFEPLASPQYYPLVFSTFWLEHRLWGLRPSGYHWVNILLHAGAAILLWLGLLRLSVPGAWLAALWFGIHPVHVESVAWITERKNVLSGIFYLGSFLACLRAFRLEGRADTTACEGFGRRAYILGLFLFTCALLSKTVTATLPVAVAIAFWWKRGRLDSPTFWKHLAPFLFLGGTTAWLEAYHVGAKGAEWSLSAIERILVAGRAVWFYAGKIVWPTDLVFIYPRWRIDAGNPLQYIPPVGAAALLLLLWRRQDQLGRGPLAAALYFGVTLAPALGFLNVYPMRYSFVADHFQYLASIGVLTPMAAAATRLAGVWRERAGRGAFVATVSAAILVSVSLAGLCWRQAAWYKDARTLWERTVEKNPASNMARWNLVDCLSRDNRVEEALREVLLIRQISPEDPEIPAAIGSLLYELKRYRMSTTYFENAIRLNPRDFVALNGLGDAHSALGEDNAAERYYRRVTSDRSATDNEYAYACEGVGVVSARSGREREALRWFEEGLRVSPENASLHYNRALLLAHMGSGSQAVSEYLEALRITPDHLMARMNLAEQYARMGDSAKAGEAFAEIGRRNPAKAEALFAQGRLMEMKGESSQSREWFQRALEAPTDYPQIHALVKKRVRK
jgi:tetratricopeptide (TPR) repeat protein